MSTNEVIFGPGSVSYVMATKENKFGKYSLNYYPKDAAERKSIKALGIRNGVKEDDGGKSGVEGFYYTFVRDPKKVRNGSKEIIVVDETGNKLDKIVGNGSEAEITLEVFDFPSGEKDGEKWEAGTAARPVRLRVTNLIEYKPEEKVEQPAVPVNEPDGSPDEPAPAKKRRFS